MARCKCCGDKFEVKYPFQKYCMLKDGCITEHVDVIRDKQKQQRYKSWTKKSKSTKEKLKTNKDYLKELQFVVNKFIRIRDKDKGCISCGKPLVGIFHAGHYFATSTSPELRFNEDNIFGQCVTCNLFLHGNLIPYTERLPLRIGIESFEKLKSLKNGLCKYSNSELIDMKEVYKQKIKDL